MEDSDKFLTRKEAAQYLGVTTNTLAVWAYTGKNELPFYLLGRMAKYKKKDLDICIENSKITPIKKPKTIKSDK
jgi:excisionase family DNA binding protein